MITRPLALAILLLAPAASHADERQSPPAQKPAEAPKPIGKLRLPLGTPVTISGVVVEGPHKGFEGGPNIRVQRIGQRYHQEELQIQLKPPAKPSARRPAAQTTADTQTLPHLKTGQTYELEGYETGDFVGQPREGRDPLIQTTDRYFHHEFIVTKAKPIPPIAYSPSMFPGEKALLSGIAKTIDGDSAMIGQDWTIIITRGAKWPHDIEGKKIESHGLYTPDPAPKKFDLKDGSWRLVELQDQVGRRVSLRGMARSLNGEWWFHYRGTDLYVENMDKLPGWNVDNHWRPMEIEGRLERAKLPRIDQISEKSDRDLADYFIVKDATWKPLPTLLFPELPDGFE